MSCIVPRTCTEVRQADTEQDRDARSRPLAEFRAVPAYVLLGDPGSGKSTSFEAESNALGEEACLVTARDFLALEPAAHPEWLGKTLFIDGLDEVRIGSSDARTPFDKLRGRLDALGRPRFRLSCREADWLGTNDRNNLATVSPDADLTVLRLDPLSDEYIEQILTTCPGIDARSFIATAREKGVAGFLDNPQCLNMLTEVVTSGRNWPGSRLELFGQACLRMVCEDNEEHIAAAERSSPSAAIAEDDLLNAAGRLCAVLLISGSAGWAVAGRREDADYPDLNRCAREHRERTRQAISTKLFKAVAEGRFRPVHRHVAEFQAGRYLARLIDGEGRNGRRGRYGLPARRIVALIAGHDGGVVTELRGLSAWIAAFSGSARNELLERDPIGVGLYGDIGEFLPQEKRDLLASLRARVLAAPSGVPGNRGFRIACNERHAAGYRGDPARYRQGTGTPVVRRIRAGRLVSRFKAARVGRRYARAGLRRHVVVPRQCAGPSCVLEPLHGRRREDEQTQATARGHSRRGRSGSRRRAQGDSAERFVSAERSSVRGVALPYDARSGTGRQLLAVLGSSDSRRVIGRGSDRAPG